MPAIFTGRITALGQKAAEINSSFLGLQFQELQLPWQNYLSLCHLWFLSSNKRKARFNKQVGGPGVWTGRVVLYRKLGKKL